MSAFPSAVRPAYFFVPVARPERRPFTDRAGGLWGELQLRGEALAPLHVGSGVPEPAGGQLAAGLPMEPGGGGGALVPVIPGSSLKGALRAVFEAVTRSCDPLSDERCQALDQTCPACDLFGFAGRRDAAGRPASLRGALAVSDLAVDGRLRTERVPQRYGGHPGAPRHGRRLYGMAPEVSPATADELLTLIDQGARLDGQLRLAGAEPAAVGALLLAAGLVPEGLPLLRLGGGKNRGFGAVRFQVTGGAFAEGRAAWLLGKRAEVTPEVLAGWAAAGAGLARQDALGRIRTAYAGGGDGR